MLVGRYPSGQREQTVNLPAYAYVGSNPSRPTNSAGVRLFEVTTNGKIFVGVKYFIENSFALLAHSVEHFHGKEEVVGSIPTEGSVI